MSLSFRISKLILFIALFQQITSGCTTRQHTPKLTQEEEIQLSTPIAHYPSTLFEDSIELSFASTYPGSHIHFTIDGTTPTEKSLLFSENRIFNTSTRLQAIAFHPKLQASEMIEIDLLQAKRLTQVQEIKLTPKPSDSYPGQGAQALIDLQKGSLNFRESAWMGFDQSQIEIQIIFDSLQHFHEVVLSTIQDHGSWIFLPKKIEVLTQQDTIISQWPIPNAVESKRLAYLHVSLDEIETQSLTIRIQNAHVIPDWHPGAGHKPWLFVDEIVLR